ncbi:sulfate ABC transporter substrate-binding protein [bacterium]|nr:sulfate ABC transporter substrate-binding protein [bacterium]
MRHIRGVFSAFCLGFIALCAHAASAAEKAELMNVSYDPTRELYNDYNRLFTKKWEAAHPGGKLDIRQSHGGSGKQARSVIDGLSADVVTLALAYDIDAIAEKSQALPADWQAKLPNNSCPYTSTIVFLVRKGNPKSIKDWNDLIRPDVKVITPNPKTSGGARWNYLAAWGYALKQNNNDEAKARVFITKLYKNVPVLDTGARGATTSFVQRGMGDVLISWENEAYLAQDQMGKDKFDIVSPSISIKAEPPVAVVEKNAAKKGTTELAQTYLKGLYEKDAQLLIAKHHYRPSLPEAEDKSMPAIPMMSIADFGGWKAAHQKHFADGGVFDQIYGAQ